MNNHEKEENKERYRQIQVLDPDGSSPVSTATPWLKANRNISAVTSYGGPRKRSSEGTYVSTYFTTLLSNFQTTVQLAGGRSA